MSYVIRTNKEKLVKMAVGGEVAAPKLAAPLVPDNSGRAIISIGMAGIIYNARVGDPAFGWKADHLEPGVKIANPNEEADYAMHYLACAGNVAIVTSGDAAGARGRVSGEHARMIIDFEPEVLEKLNLGDQVLIQAYGTGLKLLDFPGIIVRKCDPALIEAWGLSLSPEGKLRVPVTHILPPRIMGSGAELFPEFVDQDMMTEDRAYVEELGLLSLRIGDLVAVADQDTSFGREWRPGAVTISLINHGDSNMTGHGPGVQTLLSCRNGEIEPMIDAGANIARYLKYGRWSEK